MSKVMRQMRRAFRHEIDDSGLAVKALIRPRPWYLPLFMWVRICRIVIPKIKL